ncbi:nitrogen regulation protein NR(I) [Acidihalobacter ferrooxydans]|uniref:DNA-binding transcriptional regulator NtrC n=1 Tax=Acidihalobacter ferrooxydans TaxID=1765967 RepID=A0A1P8UDT1_9GAMM|nr:nitrogen regulation protein NR(I) [Acidihalobacter ferrooxydans]APZ41924.1 nitrogen regulation protein NR(I) [Acidihalobacter ferrooxydans]
MNASNNGSLWVVDDDRSIRWVLERALTGAGFDVQSYSDAESVLQRIGHGRPDALISDIRMPGLDGLELLEKVHADHPDLPVIIITAHSDLDAAVSAYQGGAFEYLPKPFDVDEAVELARRAVQRSRERPAPRPNAGLESGVSIIGEAPAMQEVFRAIGRLARSNITVLITGESGTGKELIARALHRHSPRADGPYIALNTAAIPRDLLESELFGHEKGAFTGAQAQRRGRFEQADGGTLFLDEIGDMPSELQTRLLRVLADGEFYRVGGHMPIRVDVRIIAATHQNLERRVAEGQFREDLLHRLNVIRLRLPPLRERQEDIPLLLQHFLKQAAKELDTTTKTPLPEVVEHLVHYPWPGNVRELENTCRWLTVMATGNELHLDDLPPELRQQAVSTEGLDWEAPLARWAQRHVATAPEPLLDIALPRIEQILIETALRRTGGRRQEASKLLGWGRNTLTRKIKELGMTAAEDADADETDGA